MKAYRLTATGTAPELAEMPAPEAGPGEVIVDIAACGLNFADLLMIEGTYQQTPPPPFTLGMELAGTVIGHGPGVTGPASGTRVAVMAGSGGLAERGAFPAAACLPIPDAMPFSVAAAFQVAYGTSHLALARRARLAAGETLLVLGAAGGVGLTAIEIGKLMGARVIACARGADKLAVCAAAGADHLIDSTGDDIRAAVKALGGADVVYDPVGGDQFRAALGATNPEGRILAVGFASGEVPQIPANHLLVKNIDVLGFWWGGYAHFNPVALRESMAELIGWYEEGRLAPHVNHVFELERAGDAYATLRARKSTGKIVVTMGADQPAP
ncbi:NADPH:quinone oxidoreductase family protein [Maritimibacter sp. HL-12]|uniref:NADPH:quinone oxidoreductase family protein n=1 Tax=Maritimibacter sp. HL-12 TaxID=1162418 RepID=UPI000A0F1AF8|nr:NADPH:quinone oxidoreductase family protein [Maritimibacter sp. HL-12]SMH51696.1 NADPH2:quinone reductase [Maritimibacter sp. HL-12]